MIETIALWLGLAILGGGSCALAAGLWWYAFEKAWKAGGNTWKLFRYAWIGAAVVRGRTLRPHMRVPRGSAKRRGPA